MGTIYLGYVTRAFNSAYGWRMTFLYLGSSAHSLHDSSCTLAAQNQLHTDWCLDCTLADDGCTLTVDVFTLAGRYTLATSIDPALADA